MKTTGRGMQLTRQIGEHLVAAELGRRGYVATPFAGNVPVFDLLAAGISGRAAPIQVKAINGPSWQLSAASFLDIEVTEDRQVISGRRKLPNPDLLCIFLHIKAQPGMDEFYIFQLRDLQDHFLAVYKGRQKPHNIASMHCAVWPKELQRFLGNWDLIADMLGPGLEEPTLSN